MAISLSYHEVENRWGPYALEQKDHDRAASLFTNILNKASWKTRSEKGEELGYNQIKTMITKSTGVVNVDKIVRRTKAFLLYAYQRGMQATKGILSNGPSYSIESVIDVPSDPYCFANIALKAAFDGAVKAARDLGEPFTSQTIDHINEWARVTAGVNIVVGNQTAQRTISDNIKDKIKAHNNKTVIIDIFKD